MKGFYVLALAVLLVISCSLTNPEALSAAIVKMPPKRPQNADTLKSEQTPTTSPQRCTVDTGTAQGRLNLRACPGTNCGVIFVLDEGDRLTILELGEWLQVQTDDGGTGYINSNYCRGAK